VKNIRIIAIVVAVLIILFLLMGPFFMVQEGELAVVIRFGKIEKVVTTPGLKFKVPIVDQVTKYPKKIQSWDGDAELLPTEESQFIWVDATARWKITDLKLFYESVGTITQAQSRLDDVIDSTIRNIIARKSLREAVRNSNIINQIVRKDVFKTQAGIDKEKEEKTSIFSTFTDIKYDEIREGRVKLSDFMLSQAKEVTPQYGIELIDIIIRQIKYSDDLTRSVYNRMIKERNQIAQAFRSEGEGEKAEWMGKLEKELLSIQSNAERQAKEIKAKADA
jgi:membrane protease subunit HflC